MRARRRRREDRRRRRSSRRSARSSTSCSRGSTLLAEVVGGLKIDDATARTRILEGISEAFSQQNRARAVWQGRKKELSGREGKAEFGAQFQLFGQAVTGALALCDTPETCDEQLSKLLLAARGARGRFGEFDEFTAELAQKREEVQRRLRRASGSSCSTSGIAARRT